MVPYKVLQKSGDLWSGKDENSFMTNTTTVVMIMDSVEDQRESSSITTNKNNACNVAILIIQEDSIALLKNRGTFLGAKI